MGRPYSIDLREKAVAAIESGEKVKVVANFLNIQENTLYAWINLKKETGSLTGKKNYQNGHSHKIIDLVNFKKIVDENPYDSAEKLAAKIERVSEATVLRALKKIGYSKKKLLLDIKNEKKNLDKNLWIK